MSAGGGEGGIGHNRTARRVSGLEAWKVEGQALLCHEAPWVKGPAVLSHRRGGGQKKGREWEHPPELLRGRAG